MDAQRFDALAKALATGRPSRRSLVKALAGIVAGGLHGVAGPAGATAIAAAPPDPVTSTPAEDGPEPVCPACGACETCRIEGVTGAVTCGAPCADPCRANALCAEAQGDAAYRQLTAALAADGFAPAGEPRAIAIEKDGALLDERLATEYADPQEPARTATLEFLRRPGGDSVAHAFVSKGQTFLYGLVVDADGHVERVGRDVEPAGDGTNPAARAAGPDTDTCDGCDSCESVCSFGGEYILDCRVFGPEECTSNWRCHAAVRIACEDFQPSDEFCDPFCDVFRCTPCDQECEIRSEDCKSCVDTCRKYDSNSRCVDDHCRCVAGDQVGEACEPPDRCLDGRCRCIVGNAEGEICGPIDSADHCCDTRRCEHCESGQCQTMCQLDEACCNGECRGDWIECGGTCCPPDEGLMCCNYACVNWQIDRDNCRVCGHRCGDDEICDLGICRKCDPALCESFADGECVVDCGANEVCDPDQGCLPAKPIDASMCPTLLSDAELLELMPDGTDVTSLTSFDGEDDQGNIFVLCLWDVVGHPLPAEPWFDWLVSVQAAIKVRGDVSTAAWEAILAAAEAEIGCAPATLPDDRTPVCLRDRGDAVDLTVRLDADRFLWLLLTSSKTGGAPDYPVVREATERIAAFLIAQLNPSKPSP